MPTNRAAIFLVSSNQYLCYCDLSLNYCSLCLYEIRLPLVRQVFLVILMFFWNRAGTSLDLISWEMLHGLLYHAVVFLYFADQLVDILRKKTLYEEPFRSLLAEEGSARERLWTGTGTGPVPVPVISGTEDWSWSWSFLVLMIVVKSHKWPLLRFSVWYKYKKK